MWEVDVSAEQCITSVRSAGVCQRLMKQGGEELNQVIKDAMSAFLLSNPLHADVFPGVRKMESEIVSICLDL